MPGLLKRISPEQFDQLIAYDRIEPIGVMPVYRLLVFIATSLSNQFRGEEDESISMQDIAEYAGLPKEQFPEGESEKAVSPNAAAAMFRR